MARSRTQLIASSAICAALYAVAKAVTAYVPTPWGVGQFAPGVVVPAFFAVIAGPAVAATGAGIGVFVGDLYLTALGLTTPLLSLLAGVPANAIGFYILGYILQKYRSWRAFIWASTLALLIGNLIAASGVVFYISTLLGARWPFEVQLATTLGFTLFWIVTMLPFVIPIVPALVRAVSYSSRAGVRGVNSVRLDMPKPPKIILDSVLLAALFAIVFAGLMFTPFGDLMFSKIQVPMNAFWIKILTIVASVAVLVFGPLVGLIAEPKRRVEELSVVRVSA